MTSDHACFLPFLRGPMGHLCRIALTSLFSFFAAGSTLYNYIIFILYLVTLLKCWVIEWPRSTCNNQKDERSLKLWQLKLAIPAQNSLNYWTAFMPAQWPSGLFGSQSAVMPVCLFTLKTRTMIKIAPQPRIRLFENVMNDNYCWKLLQSLGF